MADRVKLQEQQPAPDFTLPVVGADEIAPNGELHLADLRGKRSVVLYFYPKDDTPGCTAEACSFRDMNEEFGRHGALVLGISADSVDSHKKFAAKHHLPFPLLADNGARVAQEYGVYGEKSMYGKTFLGVDRATFLIDKEGVIRKIWPKVRPEEHAGEVLQTIDALKL